MQEGQNQNKKYYIDKSRNIFRMPPPLDQGPPSYQEVAESLKPCHIGLSIPDNYLKTHAKRACEKCKGRKECRTSLLTNCYALLYPVLVLGLVIGISIWICRATRSETHYRQ